MERLEINRYHLQQRRIELRWPRRESVVRFQSLYRHPDVVALRDTSEEDARKSKRSKTDLATSRRRHHRPLHAFNGAVWRWPRSKSSSLRRSTANSRCWRGASKRTGHGQRPDHHLQMNVKGICANSSAHHEVSTLIAGRVVVDAVEKVGLKVYGGASRRHHMSKS